MSPARARRRGLGRWAVNLSLLALSFGLSLGVVELVLRAMGHRALYEVYSKPSLFWQYDPLLGWSHEPGARGTYVGPRPWPVEFSAEVSINALGLRGPEIPPKSPGEARVLFLGDSMVAAFEVPYEASFVARVGTELSQRLGRPVRTINGGVRGYGSDQSYLYYRERGRKLQPDLVAFMHSANDPLDNMTVHEMRRPFGKPALRLTEDGLLELLGSPVPRYPMCSEYLLSPSFEVHRADGVAGRMLCRAQLLIFDHSAIFSVLTVAMPWDSELLRALYSLGNPHAEQIEKYNANRGSPGLDASRRLAVEIVKRLGRDVRADGARFVVTGDAGLFENLSIPELLDDGVAVKPLEALVGREQTEVRWQHDSHYNPLGHALVAEEIASFLEPFLRERLAELEQQP